MLKKTSDMTTFENTASGEQLIQHVLSNLVSGISKLNDAPASAETHFDSAINALANATEWRPTDAELVAIIEHAVTHMAFYRTIPSSPKTS
jgi:hypothetical protein